MHPILAATTDIGRALDDVASVNPLFMSTAEKAQALIELTRIEARSAELKARVLVASEDVALDAGARDVGAWLADATNTDFGVARAALRVGEVLDREEPLRAAMAAGDLTPEHARVVARVLDDLADALDPAVRPQVLEELVRLAASHSPKELQKLGAHLFDVVAPDLADQLEAERLRKAEERARQTASATLKQLGDGTSRFTWHGPDADAARLQTYLDSFMQPRKAALDADGKVQPRWRLMAAAFGDLLEQIDPDRLPEHGGDATTVIVTIDLDQLRADLGSGSIEGAGLDTGISAAEVRRLACTSGIIPAVLGGEGQVLDLGRTRRIFSPAQRKALRTRHHQCQAQGCTAPAAWSDAHHLDAWADGGLTDLDNAVLLCRRHHTMAHDVMYDAHLRPDGVFILTRRSRVAIRGSSGLGPPLDRMPA